MRRFCIFEGTTQEINRQDTDQENVFAIHASAEDFNTKYIKNS